MDFFPRNCTNKTVFADWRGGGGGKRCDLMSSTVEQLKYSLTVCGARGDLLNFSDRT